ncbi:MAG: hypothetical protein M3Z41_02470, partial [Candidatus Eremiobacteraeota bacterium]|nr:hypothetical protein [Candidatus Eremiobacteraeota bacterium]
MGTMVVGIFPDHESLLKLTSALKANRLNVEHLRVISSDTPANNLIQTGVQFIYSGDAEETAIGTGSGIITSFGGTGVPGISDHGPALGEIRTSQSVEDLLGELAIPGGRF